MDLNSGENFSFLEMLFTCISAFATVGFDLGVTSELGHLGQLILDYWDVCWQTRYPFILERYMASSL